MGAVAFDTHEFVKTLEKGGLSELQAEAISVAVRDSHQAAELATKADLRELEIKLEARLDSVEQRMDAKLEKLGLRLMIWLGGIVFVAVNAGPIISKLVHLF